MEVLTATRIGAHAHRYLTAKPRAGLVVLRFRRGLNVLFDEAAEAAVVSFLGRMGPIGYGRSS